MIYIHHHLGLGDHIVCNGLVRALYEQHGEVTLAVKNHNYPSVKQLYRDLENMHFHKVTSDAECIAEYKKQPFIRVGFENCRSDWEKSFYDQLGLDYSVRFSKFFIDRDFKREQALEEKLNLPEEFAFCNSSASTGKKEISFRTDLTIIKLEPLTDSIFDWIGVLEKATEIHTIDSSVFQIVKQLPVTGKKFFYDTRAVDPSRTIPTFEDLDWTII